MVVGLYGNCGMEHSSCQESLYREWGSRGGTVWTMSTCNGMECLCFQYIFSCDMHITIHVSRIKENDTKSSVLKTARRGKRHQGLKSDLRHNSPGHNILIFTQLCFPNILSDNCSAGAPTAPRSLILESNQTMDFICCKRI